MPYCLRLTQLQAALLYIGLRQIYISHINFERTGDCRNCHPEAPRSFNPGRFGSSDPEFVRLVFHLWEQIQPIRSSGGRIYNLDAFGLAACIFAVRVTMKKIHHGHHVHLSPREDRVADQFINRLERERKRLKRAVITELGAAAYETKAQRWTTFVRYLHFYYVYCRCSYRPRVNAYRIRRLRIDQFARWTEEALVARGEAVPSNLRALISLLLRYIRRGRAAIDFRQLETDPKYAKYVFSAFVLHRYFPK